MSHVRVAGIHGYDDEAGIRRFVRAALEMDPGVSELLHRRSPDRLVAVKPNWVQESHEYKPELWDCVITHPAVILAVVEETAAIMGGVGTISLCDAPHTYADFNAIVSRGGLPGGLDRIRGRYPRLVIETIDLRREVWRRVEQVVVERHPNPPEPRGYVRVDLARKSLFYGHAGEGRYYGADYDTGEVNTHHCGEVQEYLLAGTPVRADVFINLPKLKTHKKTGLTCCLKNLVGANGDKNWLPHHTEGTPREKGDEFPADSFAGAFERRAKRILRTAALRVPVVGPYVYRKARRAGMRVLGDSESVVRNGNWIGNDTCWRMVLDLNRALLYAGADGLLGATRKPYLAIVDGIIGGEGNGPLCPEPVASGVLVASANPAEADAAAARLMGFDPGRLQVVAHAFDASPLPIASIPLDALEIEDLRSGCNVSVEELEPAVPGGFKTHFGWKALRECR